MIENQIQSLLAFAKAMQDKALLCTKASDATAFAELSLKASSEARLLLERERVNSVLLFIECCAAAGFQGTKYPNYLEFCARNHLQILSEIDFNSVVNDVFRRKNNDLDTEKKY